LDGWTDYKQQESLRKELVELRNKLQQINAQDHFSIWAKLQREFNKKHESFEALQKQHGIKQQNHQLQWKFMWKVGYYVVMACLSLKYRSTSIVYLPTKWLRPLTWFLSYPCDEGHISGLVWLTICRIVVKQLIV
jgi:hypothetical protein